MARPIKWTKNKKAKAIKIIFDGMYNGKSCRSILDKADRNILPSYRIFLEWISNDTELSKHYIHMRDARADKIFDEILIISDKSEKDVTEKDGVKTINHNIIHRNRLQIDARKWVLAKMNPKKYGEKLEVETNNTTKITGITFDE